MANFIDNLKTNLSNREINIANFYDSANLVEKRVLQEYGAVFLNPNSNIELPKRCLFATAQETADYQNILKIKKAEIGGKLVELQETAMDSLLKVQAKVKITPKGDNPSRRSFATVLESWERNVRNGVDHWKTNVNENRKKLTDAEIITFKALSGKELTKKTFELESQKFWLHPEHNRSIAVYVAIPGASQHLFLLAIDIEEYTDNNVRKTMAENGWFQTVFQDRPHFTYLDVKSSQLTSLGLRSQLFENKEFWTPNI